MTNRFGFAGKEIYPIDFGISHLNAADIDGDGLRELIVVNNARSKINILYNQTGKTNLAAAAKSAGRQELNQLPPDSRFRIESIASEKRISSFTVADLNGDGRPDIAYYGEPKELVVQYNNGTNGWSAPKRWPIEVGLLNQNALVHGDLNGDGRTDLLLLAENHVAWLAQNADHSLAEPEKIRIPGPCWRSRCWTFKGTAGGSDAGDWDNPNPFRFRLQTAPDESDRRFTLPCRQSVLTGPMIWTAIEGRKSSPSPRSQAAPKSRISPKTGGRFIRRVAPGPVSCASLNRTAKAKRGTVWADIHGDKRSDLLVAEPESGQLTVFVQQDDGTLGPGKTFPTLTGISEVAVGDWDGDDRPEIFVLSVDERQIGLTRYDRGGRIAFPKVLPIEGRPLVMDVGVLNPNGKLALAVISDLDGKRELQILEEGGKLRRQALNAILQIESEVHHDSRRQPGRAERRGGVDSLREDQSVWCKCRTRILSRPTSPSRRQCRASVGERVGRGRRWEIRVALGSEELPARCGAGDSARRTGQGERR